MTKPPGPCLQRKIASGAIDRFDVYSSERGGRLKKDRLAQLRRDADRVVTQLDMEDRSI
jgi:hypothetical protein